MNANTAGVRITIGVSPGELLDRLTILAIKGERIKDGRKCENVRVEREALEGVRRTTIPTSATLLSFEARLKAVNEWLWSREDEIRTLERRRDFGPRFISVARSIYRLNDRRARLKREINTLLQSPLVEEKSYSDRGARIRKYGNSIER